MLIEQARNKIAVLSLARDENPDKHFDDVNAQAAEADVAEPAVIEDNVLYSLARMNELARAFKKFFKASAFDREAKERISAAFDATIQKLRSTQAALKLTAAE